ncbi:MAG TPA: hypothetical protein VEF34_12975 [Syntrophobacteraceae bacterium]|nr:hypothetical protein [Syntrophobacteraceae bacterium]
MRNQLFGANTKTSEMAKRIKRACELFFCCNAVELYPLGAIWRGSAQYADKRLQFVVKPFQRKSVGSDAELYQINERVRRTDPRIAQGFVEIMGCLPDEKAIVMEYVPGPTLQNMLYRQLWGCGSLSERFIRETAELFTCLHAIEADSIGALPMPMENLSYKDSLESIWRESAPAFGLTGRYRSPAALYRFLKEGWEDRIQPHKLLHTDAQPKNIIVSSAGVKLIDPDYRSGNPTASVAAFLLSLDRISFLTPLPNQRELVRDWKRIFLDAYLEASDSKETIIEDLFLFYPWSILNGWKQHCIWRPHMRALLGLVYGQLLRRFIDILETTWRRETNRRDCFTI